MAQAAAQLFTIHDYFELPEGGPRYQLIEGDFYMMPPPSRFHQGILRNIAFIIQGYLKKKTIGKLYFAPIGVLLTEINAYEPDLIYISNERQSILSDKAVDGAPDFVAEILSPSTERFDRTVKRSIYARTGVIEYWIINPALMEVHVYHLRKDAQNPIAVYRGKDRFESPLFTGLKFKCTEIFED